MGGSCACLARSNTIDVSSNKNSIDHTPKGLSHKKKDLNLVSNLMEDF